MVLEEISSNLPPEVHALVESARSGDGSIPLLSLPIENWSAGRLVTNAPLPKGWDTLVRGLDDVRLWKARPDILPQAGAKPPQILLDGKPAPDWNAGEEPFPGQFFFWDTDDWSLRALSIAKPSGVTVATSVELAAELSPLEGSDRFAALNRFELDRENRPAILLPAPSTLRFDLGPLHANDLSVSVGLIDLSWAPADGGITRVRGAGDGATAAVDVIADGKTLRVWSTDLDPGSSNWHQGLVDLSPWQGQPVSLQLVSDPGPSENSLADYLVWGDLRLRGPPTAPDSRPHVVLIDIDTLRPDRTSLYGSERDTTPRLAAWADSQATVFTNARTTATFTLPATVSLLTGLDVHQHGVQQFPQALSDAAAPLALLLHQAGYETRAIAEGAYLASSFGFATGFDLYATRAFKRPDWSEAMRWVSDHVGPKGSNRPLFLFLHTYLVHAPYEHDPTYADPAYSGPFAGEGLQHLDLEAHRYGTSLLSSNDIDYALACYDGLVAQMDDLVADLLLTVEASLGENTLVIFTSDHGEEFGEHGLVAHGHSLYEELLRVPFVVRFPSGAGAGVQRDDPVSLVDVVPTVLHAAGIDPGADLPGQALLSHRQVRPRPRLSRFSSDAVALEQGGWKLIEGAVAGPRGPVPGPRLFSLRDDPAEQVNLASDQPGRVATLRALLEDYLAAHPPPFQGDLAKGLKADTLEDLEQLGYLGNP